jgi:predicted RecA/RadA family phage recombinase
MQNFLEHGDVVVVTAPETADSGEFLIVGGLRGVAQAAAASGDPVPLKLSGVFELLKATGTAWSQGDRLYWDASAKKFTKTAAGNMPVGFAWADAASGDTTGQVFLSPPASGIRAVAGEVALDGSNPTPVTTGLSVILAAVACLKGSTAPGDNTSVVTVDFTGSDGTLNIYGWKNTSGNDPTLVASTGTETVEYFVWGY